SRGAGRGVRIPPHGEQAPAIGASAGWNERRRRDQYRADRAVHRRTIRQPRAKALAHERKASRCIEREDREEQVHVTRSEVEALVPKGEVQPREERTADHEIAI